MNERDPGGKVRRGWRGNKQINQSKQTHNKSETKEQQQKASERNTAMGSRAVPRAWRPPASPHHGGTQAAAPAPAPPAWSLTPKMPRSSWAVPTGTLPSSARVWEQRLCTREGHSDGTGLLWP